MVLALKSSNTLAPPAKVVEYEFSFSRSTRKMRWRHGGEEWLCNRIAGEAWCRRTDGVGGKLYLVCQLTIDENGDAEIYPPEGKLLDALRNEQVRVQPGTQQQAWADFPQGLKAHWRLCLDRARHAWRIRDEEYPYKIYATNGYRGMIKIRRYDGGPHIHADQKAWVDPYGTVQFGG